MKKTTKKDFELFKNECKRWIDYFGLDKEYRVEYFHSDEANGDRANTYDYEHLMCVDIVLPTELHEDTGIDKIKKVAFHEVCEVLLVRLRSMALDHYSNKLVTRETHQIIRKLEKLIYETNK